MFHLPSVWTAAKIKKPQPSSSYAKKFLRGVPEFEKFIFRLFLSIWAHLICIHKYTFFLIKLRNNQIPVSQGRTSSCASFLSPCFWFQPLNLRRKESSSKGASDVALVSISIKTLCAEAAKEIENLISVPAAKEDCSWLYYFWTQFWSIEGVEAALKSYQSVSVK